MLVDNALGTSHFHELAARARLLALRLQFEQSDGWPPGPRLNQGVLT